MGVFKGLFGGGSNQQALPPPPPTPQAPIVPPSPGTPGVMFAGANQRSQAGPELGGTMLTGMGGLTKPATTTSRKSLLGD